VIHRSTDTRTIARRRVVKSIVIVALLSSVVVGTHSGPSGAATTPTTTPSTSMSSDARYPVGVPSATEPSGEAPPGADALAGYQQTYVQDFDGTTLPPQWDIFTGVPAPGGHFGFSHVAFRNGLMELLAFRNPLFGNRWVTGGI
jgi:hypothetical protein